MIDQAVKAAVEADSTLSRLLSTSAGHFGPDFVDAGTGRWYDITTRGQFQAHLDRYPFGVGIGLFTG